MIGAMFCSFVCGAVNLWLSLRRRNEAHFVVGTMWMVAVVLMGFAYTAIQEFRP